MDTAVWKHSRGQNKFKIKICLYSMFNIHVNIQSLPVFHLGMLVLSPRAAVLSNTATHPHKSSFKECTGSKLGWGQGMMVATPLFFSPFMPMVTKQSILFCFCSIGWCVVLDDNNFVPKDNALPFITWQETDCKGALHFCSDVIVALRDT